MPPPKKRERLEARQNETLRADDRASDTEIGGLFDPADRVRADLFDNMTTAAAERMRVQITRDDTRCSGFVARETLHRSETFHGHGSGKSCTPIKKLARPAKNGQSRKKWTCPAKMDVSCQKINQSRKMGVVAESLPAQWQATAGALGGAVGSQIAKAACAPPACLCVALRAC